MTFWDDGEYHQFQRPRTREQVVAILSGQTYADRHPRVWSKDDGDSVAVAVAVAVIVREAR